MKLGIEKCSIGELALVSKSSVVCSADNAHRRFGCNRSCAVDDFTRIAALRQREANFIFECVAVAKDARKRQADVGFVVGRD